MFQEAFFSPGRNFGARAAALPAAVLIHALALSLALTIPLLSVGDLPRVDLTDVIVVPAPPMTPLPPPKGSGGKPGGTKIKQRPQPAVAPAGWRFAPVEIPDGIIEESIGAGGGGFGIPEGVDYGEGGAVPTNIIGETLFNLVGAPSEAPVRAAGEVRPPRLIRRVEPDYPEMARLARVEGTVILEAVTDIYGRVSSVRVLRSIPLLDEAAAAAVRQWLYEPMIINGRPRPVVFTVTVRFVLQK